MSLSKPRTGARSAWLLALTTACSAAPPETGSTRPSQPETAASHRSWDAPPLERSIVVRDGRTGEVIELAPWLDALAEADAVFLGETHIDETTHRVQLGVYQGLLERREGRVVLALEMFERDVQEALDAYVAGRIDEEEFLESSRPWNNYRTAYRPMVEEARELGGKVVASNYPRTLRSRGRDGLDEEQRALVPRTLEPNTKAYWRRVDNAVRGHLQMMGPRTDEARLTSTQSLWDNSMGEACADLLDTYPDHQVLHVNGGFHSAYRDGTVHQLQLRKPQARIATVAIVPVMQPLAAEVGEVPVADYVVFVEERARDVNEGKHAVTIPRTLEYRLHLPGDVEGPLPLLLWLSEDGLTAADGLELWKSRLGARAAIAALEPLYPQTQADLSEGGRWYRPGSFAEDMGALGEGIERIWAFLLRHHDIDPQRVCLAGEGTGATVVALTTLMTDRMAVRGLALEPRQFAKIKDVPLPLPEYRGETESPRRSLEVIASASTAQWWRSELEEYEAVGLRSLLTPATEDPWQREDQKESALRAALGLEPAPSMESGRRLYLFCSGEQARERQWTRLEALRRSELEDAPVAVVRRPPELEGALPLSRSIRPRDFAKGDALPMCPGPFGGTTVVWLPPETEESDREEWLAIEEDDPIGKRSRFHRLRIATADGERSLPDVVTRLRDQGRKNILVVPAMFYADVLVMRELQAQLRDVADELTLHWQPGLGGR